MAKHTTAWGASCRCKFVLAALALLVALAALPAWARGERGQAARQTGDSGPADRAAPSATTAAPRISSKTTAAPPGFTRPEHLAPSRHYRFRFGGEVKTMRFFGVTAKERPSKEYKDMRALTVWIGKKKVIQDDGIRESLSWSYALKDFPRPGMATLVLRVDSGGAHCCMTYYLLTRLRDGNILMTVANLEDGMDSVTPDSDVSYPLEIHDGRFFLYATRGDKKPGLWFCTADSPILTRYLVYDQKGWRVDRAGEFPEAYRGLMVETEKEQNTFLAKPLAASGGEREPILRDMELTGFLMRGAYYALMAGESDENVRQRFYAEIPKEFSQLAQEIFEDVRAATQSFNPVTQRVY